MNQHLISATCTIIALSGSVSAWTTPAVSLHSARAVNSPTTLFSTPDPDNPCWQDSYDGDDDCLSSTYSAAFVAEDWIKSTPAVTLHSARAVVNSPTALFSTPDPNNPSWQECYDGDDDCLSTTYSAAFVAEDWIKSMPCGEDADCLPEELSHPGTMVDSGVDKVNVMEYLNIRKAAPVSEKSGKGGAAP